MKNIMNLNRKAGFIIVGIFGLVVALSFLLLGTGDLGFNIIEGFYFSGWLAMAIAIPAVLLLATGFGAFQFILNLLKSTAPQKNHKPVDPALAAAPVSAPAVVAPLPPALLTTGAEGPRSATEPQLSGAVKLVEPAPAAAPLPPVLPTAGAEVSGLRTKFQLSALPEKEVPASMTIAGAVAALTRPTVNPVESTPAAAPIAAAASLLPALPTETEVQQPRSTTEPQSSALPERVVRAGMSIAEAVAGLPGPHNNRADPVPAITSAATAPLPPVLSTTGAEVSRSATGQQSLPELSDALSFSGGIAMVMAALAGPTGAAPIAAPIAAPPLPQVPVQAPDIADEVRSDGMGARSDNSGVDHVADYNEEDDDRSASVSTGEDESGANKTLPIAPGFAGRTAAAFLLARKPAPSDASSQSTRGTEHSKISGTRRSSDSSSGTGKLGQASAGSGAEIPRPTQTTISSILGGLFGSPSATGRSVSAIDSTLESATTRGHRSSSTEARAEASSSLPLSDQENRLRGTSFSGKGSTTAAVHVAARGALPRSSAIASGAAAAGAAPPRDTAAKAAKAAKAAASGYPQSKRYGR